MYSQSMQRFEFLDIVFDVRGLGMERRCPYGGRKVAFKMPRTFKIKVKSTHSINLSLVLIHPCTCKPTYSLDACRGKQRHRQYNKLKGAILELRLVSSNE